MTQLANNPPQATAAPQAPTAPPQPAAALTAPMPPARFHDAAEWWHELGDVPLQRIVMNPWPGFATEGDLVLYAERDKRLCELVDGTLVEKPVGQYESLIAARLIAALIAFVTPRKLGFVTGEAGMNRMASGNVRMPDVTFISVDDLPGREFPRTPIPTLKPTIAAEVLSASNTAAEIRSKLQDYFQSGTRLAWVIDPETQTVDVYDRTSTRPVRVLVSTDVLDGGTVLQGFQVNVADLFVTLL